MNTGELLTKAADLIEAAAKATTPGPWNDITTDATSTIYGGPREDGYLTGEVLCLNEEALEFTYQPKAQDLWWMAVMNPDIAAPLALWLRTTAILFEDLRRVDPYATAFAEALLGQKVTDGGKP